jgi:hypothetical protein
MSSQKGFSAKREAGFTPILVLLIIFLLGFFIFKNPTLKERLNLPQQDAKQESNILNRVYYFKLGESTTDPYKELDYIDVGSGEKGKIDLNTDLISYKSLPTRYNDSPNSSAQLTPDKKFIIFEKDPSNNDANLYLFNIEKKDITQLTTEAGPPENGVCPVKIDFLVSGDSKKIYYRISNAYFTLFNGQATTINGVCKPRLNQSQDWIVTLDGKKQRLENTPKGSVIAWSQNSSSLYYSLLDSEPFLVSFNPATEDSKEVLKDTVSSLYWSRDGSKGVYVGLANFNHLSKSYGKINLISSDFSILGSLDPREGVPEGDAFFNSAYDWNYWGAGPISPDGKNVVVIKIPQTHFADGDAGWKNNILSQKSEVYLWNTSTKEKTKLPVILDSNAVIKWTADGSKLIYHTMGRLTDNGTETKDSNALYIYDLKSKKQTLLIDFYNEDKYAHSDFLLF